MSPEGSQSSAIRVYQPTTHDWPVAHASERALLGAVLLANPKAVDALGELDTTVFSQESHRIIASRLKGLFSAGFNPDLILLVGSLTGDELERVGGVGYVSGLTDGIPRVFDVGSHVCRICQSAMLRRLAVAGERIRELAINAKGNTASILQEIRQILSAHLSVDVGQKRTLRFRTGTEVAEEAPKEVDWVALGLVARGAITELVAKVKAGKTTLVLAMVRAALDGLWFLGHPTTRTSTVYLTEQPVVSFREALAKAELLGRSDFSVLFRGEVGALPWPDVARAAVRQCRQVGAELLVVDTLPQFAGLVGDQENNSGDALAAMRPLQEAAEQGIAVVVTRHERKSGGEVGDSGRGSSAFAGVVDIALSLRRPEGNFRKTMRLLKALSRFSDTPPQLMIEHTEEGTYVSRGAPRDSAQKETAEVILRTAPNSVLEAQTLEELSKATQESRTTVQRGIDTLLEAGMLKRVGEGKRGSPFRYFRAEDSGGNRLCPTPDMYGQKRIDSLLCEEGEP